MDDNKIFKLPRLYTKSALTQKGVIALSESQAHYLHNVLRRQEGGTVRLFNGKDGEWIGHLKTLHKKNAQVLLENKIKIQPVNQKRTHLLFAPIKKNRMDWLIEKSVELGVTDLHPILTQNTEARKIKQERMTTQILEASEQCERLSIPALHALKKLNQVLAEWNQNIELLTCLEREDATSLTKISKDIAILIGPEGGFTAEEKEILIQKTKIVTLGSEILRTETAALKALSILNS